MDGAIIGIRHVPKCFITSVYEGTGRYEWLSGNTGSSPVRVAILFLNWMRDVSNIRGIDVHGVIPKFRLGKRRIIPVAAP